MSQSENAELTSSSFSGLPFSPPLGNWRSDNQLPRVSLSTLSSSPRIAKAAVQTHTTVNPVTAAKQNPPCPP